MRGRPPPPNRPQGSPPGRLFPSQVVRRPFARREQLPVPVYLPEPDEELPDSELSDTERREAMARERWRREGRG
jgi:hypothetical protein